MSQRKTLIRVLGITLVFAMLVGSAYSAVASQPEVEMKSAEPDVMSIANDNPNLASAWTAERLAAAKPAPMPEFIAGDSGAPSVQGEPGFHPSGAPDAGSDAAASEQFPEAFRQYQKLMAIQDGFALPQALASGPEGTPAEFTGWRGNKWWIYWKHWPYRTIGKLYFSIGTDDHYCSASVLSDKDYGGGRDTLLTAAHCLYTPGSGWHQDFLFVPAYRKGVAPYGVFPFHNAWVLTDWVNTGATRYDVGVASLQTNGVQEVTYYTGYMGKMWNWDYVEHMIVIAYPSNLPNGAKYTYHCAAETFYDSTDVVGMGCNMTFGSSGGPWIWDYEYFLIEGCWVGSVVSGGTPGTDTFYGPRFSDDNIIRLCNSAMGGCW